MTKATITASRLKTRAIQSGQDRPGTQAPLRPKSTQSLQGSRMQVPVRCQDPAVVRQSSAGSEIQRFPIQIGYPASCCFDNERASCLVPDLFSIIRLLGREQAKINLTPACSQNSVLCLAVHSDPIGSYIHGPGKRGDVGEL